MSKPALGSLSPMTSPAALLNIVACVHLTPKPWPCSQPGPIMCLFLAEICVKPGARPASEHVPPNSSDSGWHHCVGRSCLWGGKEAPSHYRRHQTAPGPITASEHQQNGKTCKTPREGSGARASVPAGARIYFSVDHPDVVPYTAAKPGQPDSGHGSPHQRQEAEIPGSQPHTLSLFSQWKCSG
ncbi:unnamed protein product [Eretmochelys imbricata]